MKDTPLRPVLWIGSSLKDLKSMPVNVQKELGHSIRDLQKKRDPGNTKSLKHLGETGVSEIMVDEREGTFRTIPQSAKNLKFRPRQSQVLCRLWYIYTVEFKDALAVLHVFQKKSKEGIETPKKEIDLVLKRLKQARIEYQEWKREK